MAHSDQDYYDRRNRREQIMRADSRSPVDLSKRTAVTLSTKFIVTSIAVIGGAIIAWASLQNRTLQNESAIILLTNKQETDHDILIELRADMKTLLHKQGLPTNP